MDLVPPLHLPFLDVTVETRTALPFPLLTVQTNGEGYGPPDVAMADGTIYRLVVERGVGQWFLEGVVD